MEKSNTFCTMPFIGTMINTDGRLKYCCIAEGDNTDLYNNGKLLDIENSTILEAYNSDTVRDIRKKMINGEEVSGCSKCYFQSKIGRNSYKDMMIKEWNHRLGIGKINSIIRDASANDGIVNSTPVYLDLRLGNLCNFKCRSCNPYNSVSIAKEHFILWEESDEYKRIYESEFGGSPIHLKNSATWFDSDMLWNQIIDMIPTLKKVYMTGGEPTLIQNNYYFMEKCIELGRSDISLFFNTNCSNVSEKFLNILSKFNNVDINASIDGIGSMNEYARFPSNWEKISKNFEQLAQLKNVNLGISPVVQIYNIFDIHKIIDYICDVNEKYNKKIFIDFLINTHPKNLDVKILPTEIKNEARLKLEKYLEIKFEDSTIPIMTRDSTNAILNLLKEDRIPNSDFYLNNFISYTKILDKNRKQVFSEVCPELNKLLEKYVK